MTYYEIWQIARYGNALLETTIQQVEQTALLEKLEQLQQENLISEYKN